MNCTNAYTFRVCSLLHLKIASVCPITEHKLKVLLDCQLAGHLPYGSVNSKLAHPCPSKAEENIEVEGKQSSLFPVGPVIKCFVIPPDLKVENKTKNCEKMSCLTRTRLCL